MAKKVRIDFYNLLIPDYVLLMCYVILVKWLKQTNKLWELFLNSWPQYLLFFGMWGTPYILNIEHKVGIFVVKINYELINNSHSKTTQKT